MPLVRDRPNLTLPMSSDLRHNLQFLAGVSFDYFDVYVQLSFVPSKATMKQNMHITERLSYNNDYTLDRQKN